MFGNRSILAEAPRPEAVRRYPRAPWLAVGVVCFGAFMGQLDASIVTLTFRPMEHEFGAPLAAVQWVSLAYLLALVALLAPAGRLADAVGRKLIYGYGFVIFTAGSVACGLAPSLGILVACRLAQAVGAAMLQANSVALVTTSVPPHRMRLALSVQAAAQAIGLGLGPTLGGLLTETVGWRAVYWINVPVGCIAILAARFLLPRTRQLSRAGAFDWPGAALLAVATTSLLLALSAAAGLPVPVWGIVALAALAAGAAAAFAVRELRARHPLIPVALLRSARVALGLTGALLGYLALFGPLVLIPVVLAGHGNGGELRAGLVLSALPAGFGVAALSGEAVFPAGVSNRVRGCIGASACAVALAILIVVPKTVAGIVPCLALAGLGLGVFVPANNAVIMRSSEPRSAAVLGGLVNIARGIGTTLGIALVTLALHVVSAGSSARPGTERPDPWLALTVLAAAAAAGAVVAMLIRPLPGGGAGQGDPGGSGPSGAGHGEVGHARAFS
jgi:EmrB/QacA subfamily drug resistance transporter